MTSATMLSHCISPLDYQLIQMQVTIPRVVLAEINTHRLFLPGQPFSLNAASSRAKPVKKMIEEVLGDPFIPDRFPINGKGMQPAGYYEPGSKEHAACVREWLGARDAAISHVDRLRGMEEVYDPETNTYFKLNVHKEITNRLIEPSMYTTIVLSGTHRDGEPGAWTNFEAQRCHPDAQRQIKEAADMMRELRLSSTPRYLEPGQFSTPYIEWSDLVMALEHVLGSEGKHGIIRNMTDEEFNAVVCKMSVSRIARTSYKNNPVDGEEPRTPTVVEDLGLNESLETKGHFSPFEHVATPATDEQLYPYVKGEPVDLLPRWRGNFAGWVQIRKWIAGEMR